MKTNFYRISNLPTGTVKVRIQKRRHGRTIYYKRLAETQRAEIERISKELERVEALYFDKIAEVKRIRKEVARSIFNELKGVGVVSHSQISNLTKVEFYIDTIKDIEHKYYHENEN